MALRPADIARVKGMGFLINRGTECFSGRIVPAGSVFTAEDLSAVAELARRFGNGKIAFTSRLALDQSGKQLPVIHQQTPSFLKAVPLYGYDGDICNYT